MQSAARITDLHACSDSGPNPGANLEIIQGSPNITINGMPAARVGDQVSCRMSSSPTTIATGANNVLFNGKPAARMGDTIANGGSILNGSGNVFIGDGSCLISIGDGVQVEFGDGCIVYLNCGSDASSSTTPAQPPSNLLNNLEKYAGYALMAGGLPLDEVGVGEGMQIAGAEMVTAAKVAKEAAAVATETTAKDAATAEASTAEKAITEESSASKVAEKPEAKKGPTAGNTIKSQCGKVVQSGGNTISNGTAKTLNKNLNENLTSREWGRAVENLKDQYDLENDYHGKITEYGYYLDKEGNNVIGYIGDFLP